MSKRLAGDDGAAGLGPPRKRVLQEPLKSGPISNLEELEVQTLQFQNQKLCLRLNQRIKAEDDLRQRIDQLEKRQTQDDAVMNVIHRYWNQLNEDIRILLQRFDAETGDEGEKDNEHESTKSFLAQLSSWHKQELDEKLASRVQVSQRAVAKIIQVFDHMIQRNEKVCLAIHQSPAEGGGAKKNGSSSTNEKDGGDDGKGGPDAVGGGGEQKVAEGKKNEESEPSKKSLEDPVSLDEVVKEMNMRLQRENRDLHHLNTSLHEKNHFLSLKAAESEELMHAETTKNEELQNKLDDLEYELTKCRMKNGKMEASLLETQETLKMYVEKDGGKLEQKVVLSNAERKTVEQLSQDLEEQREIAATRLLELEQMSVNFKDALKEVERLKMELSTLPEHVVVETTEHKCLQSQFSVLYNEAMQLKTQLEESRSQSQVNKNAHMRQIEQMEAEELLAQKKLRMEAIQLEDMLAQVRKEYEMLRIEYEQNLAANEQTGPINKEMRNLITSLQTHNVQLKGEVARYKRRLKESNTELGKTKKELEEYRSAEFKMMQERKEKSLAAASAAAAVNESGGGNDVVEVTPGGNALVVDSSDSQETSLDEAVVNGNGKVRSELMSVDAALDQLTEDAGNDSPDCSVAAMMGTPVRAAPGTPVGTPVKRDAAPSKEIKDRLDEAQRLRARDQDVIKDLRNQHKKTLKEMNEMKLLLDMHNKASQEKRDKAQIMAAEKKVKSELEDVRNQFKRVTESKRDERKRMADEDATRRIKQLEDQLATLQRQALNYKQDEEALIREMDVTGEAFDNLQEQNLRLIQQLREKDDANFKLMSERIKYNQLQRLAQEEKDTLAQQGNTLSTQVETQNQVVRKLEEKERLLQSSFAAMEKELAMRQQAMEMHKRKAIESAQSAADLKLHLEKYHSQIKEVQQTIAEKTSALEAEAFKTKRLHEELVLAKRKVERLRKIEMATDTNMDQILKEEIREYKETLTCPSCKVKRKDAVLTKCFHCFCYDCLRTRYETRQRKCPKCNAAFGASDYHRLFLA